MKPGSGQLAHNNHCRSKGYGHTLPCFRESGENMRRMFRSWRSSVVPMTPVRPQRATRTAQVSVGDRFVKFNEPHSAVWVVVAINEPVPGLPHARLVKEGGTNSRDGATVSLASLRDGGFYVPYQGRPQLAAE
jgi:hypothetical protein